MFRKILVILGPTASGKSDMAVKLAKKFSASGGAEIISADSRQVYKGLDIGTGKITKKEMRGIPHYLLDVASAQKQFSVSDFKKLGEKAIEKILAKNKLPIICGGTGLYIATLLGEMDFPEVPPNPTLRKQLGDKPVGELFNILRNLDPDRSESIDKNNPRRLIRAIEIAVAEGGKEKFKKTKIEKKYDVIKIGIKIDEEELKNRINKRIDKWFKAGLLNEVGDLHRKGLSWKRMSEIGLEYKIVSEFLQNKINEEEMREKMRIENYQYAKRQKTWFKRDKNIIWVSPQESGLAIARTASFLTD